MPKTLKQIIKEPTTNKEFFNKIRQQIRQRQKVDDRSQKELSNDSELFVFAIQKEKGGLDNEVVSIGNCTSRLLNTALMTITKLLIDCKKNEGTINEFDKIVDGLISGLLEDKQKNEQ